MYLTSGKVEQMADGTVSMCILLLYSNLESPDYIYILVYGWNNLFMINLSVLLLCDVNVLAILMYLQLVFGIGHVYLDGCVEKVTGCSEEAVAHTDYHLPVHLRP